MNNVKAIRERLGITQAALAEGMGCTQGNVGHYEKGQTIPPDAAGRLIAFARTKGLDLSYDDVYGVPHLGDSLNTPAATPKPAEPPVDPDDPDSLVGSGE